jgi:Flp pilus assembly protein TadD
MQDSRIKALILSCGVALTGGCALFEQTSQPQRAVAPVSNVTHSAAVANAHYQIGRFYQSRLLYERAIAAYGKALEVNTGDAEARNALGVIYANQGKHEQAIAELKVALRLAPAAAHIHNNLGYAYLLQGQNVDALAAFNIASSLDPDNKRSRANIKTAQRRLSHTLNASIAPVGAEITLPLTNTDNIHTKLRLLAVAPNVYELRQASPRQVKFGAPFAIQTARGSVRLEIANGNGVTGLAKRTASSLRQKGYATARLTDQVPFTRVLTEIQYRAGHEQDAERLNALFATPVKIRESTLLRVDVEVRLVLGRDVAERSLFTASRARNSVAPIQVGGSEIRVDVGVNAMVARN